MSGAEILLPDLLATCAQALAAAQAFRDAARQAVADLVAPAGKIDSELFFALEGFSAQL